MFWLNIDVTFRSWIAAMELDDYQRYLHLMGKSIEIVTEIPPHYSEMFPGGVEEMTADLERSAAHLTVKIK